MATSHSAATLAGPGEELETRDVQSAPPAPGQVLIRNFAIALQPLDAKMLLAGYGPAASLKYPAVLGTSGAGIIEAVGEGVSGIEAGDRVVFDTKAYVEPAENLIQGTWQQLVICDARTTAKVVFRKLQIVTS